MTSPSWRGNAVTTWRIRTQSSIRRYLSGHPIPCSHPPSPSRPPQRWPRSARPSGCSFAPRGRTGKRSWPPLAPSLLASAGVTLPPWALLATALTGLVLLLGLFRRLAPFVSRRMSLALPNPPWPSFARYVAGCAAGWAGYGLAFWLLSRALLGEAAPELMVAAPAFIASYVAGIIAVFAPGGIVVREAALVATLAGHVGADRAFLLAVAARLWAISLEILGVVTVLALPGPAAPADDQGLRS